MHQKSILEIIFIVDIQHSCDYMYLTSYGTEMVKKTSVVCLLCWIIDKNIKNNRSNWLRFCLTYISLGVCVCLD